MAFKSLNTEIELVGIIDMLPAQERKSLDITGELVRFLAAIPVDHKYGECSTNAEVFSALRQFRTLSKNKALMLHFVSHGNSDGIGIKGSTEPVIKWDELRSYLLALNRELGGALIINLTSCFGFEGVRMVKADDIDLPFYGLIGCEQKLYPDDAKKVNQLFYQGMADGKEIPLIVIEIIKQYRRKVIYGRTAQTQQEMINPKGPLEI
jgi:hypothetical protein